MTPKRIELLGVPVDCVTMPQALEFVEEHIATGSGCASILAVNPEKVMRSREDSALLASLRKASLLIPDGIGVVWAARVLGLARFGRVPGSELMPNICERVARRQAGVFLFGAREDVNAAAAEILPRRYPGLRIAGRQHGYVVEGELPALIRRINQSGADVLFLALGSPKQEAWIERFAPQLQVKVAQGIGGTLDVVAGRVKRAPALFLALNLEWLYRLLREPSRIWRQRVLAAYGVCILAEILAKFSGRREGDK